MSKIDIAGLSVAERLDAIEALWDSLAHEGDEIASPDWHRAVLDERQRRIDSGTAAFFSVAELRARRRG
jgi:putative addiction module component (TIGR02574 family)